MSRSFRALFPIALSSLVFLLPGCGDDSAVASSGVDTDNLGTTDPTDPTGAGEEEEGEEVYEAIPARGIAITRVTATQGVQVLIGQNGEWVSERTVGLVNDRDTLIRAHFQIDTENWVPNEGGEQTSTPERTIEGRLKLIYPDGSEDVKTSKLDVYMNSVENDVKRTFFWPLSAADGEAVPGMRYQVSLWETAPGVEEIREGGQALTEAVNITPPQSELIGFENVEMRMKVMLVPFNYGPTGVTPELDDTSLGILTSAIMENNPLQELDIQIHDVVDYSQPLNSLGSLLPLLDQMRAVEGAPSNVYYTGLIETGQQSGVVGIAYLNGRVNANLWRNSKFSTAETVVHEIGHNQGLSHVFCEGGGATGTDPTYPVSGGFLDGWGFGIRGSGLQNPGTHFDFMTYCGPVWTSAWTWMKNWNVIRQDTAVGDVVEDIPVLRGAIYPDGSEEWWTSYTTLDEDNLSANHSIDFVRNGEVIVSEYAYVDELTDDETIWLTVPMPEANVKFNFDSVERRSFDVLQKPVAHNEVKIIQRSLTQ